MDKNAPRVWNLKMFQLLWAEGICREKEQVDSGTQYLFFFFKESILKENQFIFSLNNRLVHRETLSFPYYVPWNFFLFYRSAS